MKMKRQRMKRWLRTDAKRRENEKTEKEKVAENRWRRQRKLKQIKKTWLSILRKTWASYVIPQNDYVADLI